MPAPAAAAAPAWGKFSTMAERLARAPRPEARPQPPVQAGPRPLVMPNVASRGDFPSLPPPLRTPSGPAPGPQRSARKERKPPVAKGGRAVVTASKVFDTFRLACMQAVVQRRSK